jgi:hypothetical protein
MNESLSDITPNTVSLDVRVLSQKTSLNKENDHYIGGWMRTKIDQLTIRVS